MEIAARNAEGSRAFGFAPAALSQRPKDEAPLESAHFIFVGTAKLRFLGDLCGFRWRWGASQGCRQFCQIDVLVFRQNHGALHYVLQLPDIARPVVLFESIKRSL